MTINRSVIHTRSQKPYEIGPGTDKNTSTDNSAATASTSGYCHDMREPHQRHRPRKKIKEKMGTKSSASSVCPQLMQRERPSLPDNAKIRRPVLKRNDNALRKLPMMAPKTAAERTSKKEILTG